MSGASRTPRYWFDGTSPPLLARAVAPVYAAAVALRASLYRRGWLRRGHPGAPVVVVGNLIAGGSGKTPLTIAIVQRLRAEGWTPGVASRGYGRRDAATPRWVDRDTAPADGGDEPVLIAHRTGARVRVDRDRLAAARALVAEGCDIVVCDDGLQHYRLMRDVEIEVIDGRRRYGNGRPIPAGPLREAVARGASCDFRVVNLGAMREPDAAIDACGFGEWPMRLAVDAARALRGARTLPLSAFADRRVHAVAGIGDPERFFETLRDAGIAVVPHAFPDHHRYVAEDLRFGSDLPVLMTEKDAVKCAGFAGDDHYAVAVRAELPEAFWVALTDLIEHPREANV
ncbi:MAG: tetraacyldisaccharide 4'-kinase [Lysobacter sp.]|nr:tetraacyldisaccharide 4'-kinase [Lysobacter sp.]